MARPTLVSLASRFLQENDLPHALRCAQILADPPSEPAAAYDAAQLYARLATLAPSQESRSAYQDRSLQLLKGLVERDYLALPRLEKEPAFKGLAQHAGFAEVKRLAAERWPLFTQVKESW